MVQPPSLATAAAESMPVDLSSVALDCPAEHQSAWISLQGLLLGAQEREANEIHIEPESDCLRLRYRSAFEFEEIRIENSRDCLQAMQLLRQHLHLQAPGHASYRAWFTLTLTQDKLLYQFDVIDTRKGSTYRLLQMHDYLRAPQRLEDIGLNRAQMDRLEQALGKRNGLVVVASNLTSARRHTSRAITQRLVAPERKIIMADVPMHPELPRTTQMELDYPPSSSQIETWDALCRLGADAVITTQPMLDEDARRLANLATSESLVVQTIRAGSAPSCLSRLLGLGIRSEVLAQCLSLIVLQYRVRCLCTQCRVPATPDDRGTTWLARFSPILAGNINHWLRHRMRSSFSRAEGCQHCNYSGHQRWLDIFDIISIGSEVREALTDGDHARAQEWLAGNQNLGGSLLRLVQEGIISLDEAIRVSDEMDEERSMSSHVASR